jgi:hypothetical protein
MAGQIAPVGAGAWLSHSRTLTRERGSTLSGDRVALDVPVDLRWRLNLSFERSESLHPGQAGERRSAWSAPFFDRGLWLLTGPGRRNALHVGVGYVADNLVVTSGGELRFDEHLPLQLQEILGEMPTTHRQAVLTLAGRWRATEGLVFGGRVAWAETFGMENGGQGAGDPEGGFLEGSLGAAYRPESISWLRLLARLSAGKDLRPELALQGWPIPETWVFGTLAVLFEPSRWFQPTVVLAPTWRSQPWYATSGRRTHESVVLHGMLRVGSQLVAGLGVSGEVRMRWADRTFEVQPVLEDTGFAIGAAAEVFYQLEDEDWGGVRLGIGYSFSDLPDPLSDLFTGRQGVFFRLEGML